MASGANVEDFASLIEAVATRQDRAAFTRVFAYYGPRVKAYLLRLGLDSAEAEETAQEVMVAVWRKAPSFDRAQASAATWIFRIARNRRIDLFRRDQRAQLDANDPAFQPAAEATPDQAAEAAEREDQVRRAMAELPPDQRDLVRRAFYEDQSHSEIAAETGVPLGTVKSRLRLAFAKLKLKLATSARARTSRRRSHERRNPDQRHRGARRQPGAGPARAHDPRHARRRRFRRPRR